MNGLELLFSESARKELSYALTNKILQDNKKNNLNVNIIITEK